MPELYVPEEKECTNCGACKTDLPDIETPPASSSSGDAGGLVERIREFRDGASSLQTLLRSAIAHFEDEVETEKMLEAGLFELIEELFRDSPKNSPAHSLCWRALEELADNPSFQLRLASSDQFFGEVHLVGRNVASALGFAEKIAELESEIACEVAFSALCTSTPGSVDFSRALSCLEKMENLDCLSQEQQVELEDIMRNELEEKRESSLRAIQMLVRLVQAEEQKSRFVVSGVNEVCVSLLEREQSIAESAAYILQMLASDGSSRSSLLSNDLLIACVKAAENGTVEKSNCFNLLFQVTKGLAKSNVALSWPCIEMTCDFCLRDMQCMEVLEHLSSLPSLHEKLLRSDIVEKCCVAIKNGTGSTAAAIGILNNLVQEKAYISQIATFPAYACVLGCLTSSKDPLVIHAALNFFQNVSTCEEGCRQPETEQMVEALLEMSRGPSDEILLPILSIICNVLELKEDVLISTENVEILIVLCKMQVFGTRNPVLQTLSMAVLHRLVKNAKHFPLNSVIIRAHKLHCIAKGALQNLSDAETWFSKETKGFTIEGFALLLILELSVVDPDSLLKDEVLILALQALGEQQGFASCHSIKALSNLNQRREKIN